MNAIDSLLRLLRVTHELSYLVSGSGEFFSKVALLQYAARRQVVMQPTS